jgi:hypothetical protein
MAQSETAGDSPKTLLQPPCSACGAPMWLVRLTPFKPDHDQRTFKCQVCNHTESVVTKFQ